MEHRRLGRSELRIAPLVLGGNVFGWTADEATSFSILDAFVDAGFNAIDTADVYIRGAQDGVGASERLIGRWLQHSRKRDKVVLMTKVGGEMGDGLKGLSGRYIPQALEASLGRLQTDYVDLYQAHRDDADVPQEETLEAFDRLIGAGKIRALGSSNFTPERLRSALEISRSRGLARFESEQPLYNLYSRAAFEKDLRDLVLSEQLGAIPYFGLASGFLTGKYRTESDLSKSPRGRLVRSYLNPRGLRILAALDEVAARQTASPAQAALAWVMAQPGITAPIASATSLGQLEEILGAARIKLAPEDLATLSEASSGELDPAPT